ncbi:MAG TPA: serine hydrolase domain-containing protein [Thermoanaerobaculia bacterium]|nr:serine hydrolase domain-containing protein [Thermoanaerobaculia bacterium]
MTPIDDFLQSEIDLGSFSGAAYAIGTCRTLLAEGALGFAVRVPFRIPATIDTIFDLASLTKPLVTTALALQAVDDGAIRLDDPISRVIVELDATDKKGITIRQLMSHSSGLAAWLPLYAFGSTEDAYIRAIANHPRECEPGTRVIYSDLNFVLLYCMLQRVSGDYVALANQRIVAPLQLRSTMFNPPAHLRPHIAATEWGQRFEGRLSGDKQTTIAGKGRGLMWGEANDGNSFHLGGTAGNAGLFATVRDVLRIAQAWCDGRETLLPNDLIAEATRNQTAGLDENRGLGWQLCAGKGDAMTNMLSTNAFGHTGFTGTSLWIDAPADRICVLLTNRVHPSAAPVAMARIRGMFHALAQQV